MADPQGLTLFALGTAGAYRAHPGARGSGYLVRSSESSVVLDLGHGAYAPLAAEIGIAALASLGAVCITHLHPDHWVDLVALRHALVHGSANRDGANRDESADQHLGGLIVAAPDGLAGRLAVLLDARSPMAQAAGPEHRPDPFPVRTWSALGYTVKCGPITVCAHRVRHTDESYALRMTTHDEPVGTPGLVYSGDLSHWEDVVPLIQPGDTLLCEATLGAAPWSGDATHVSAEGAGRAAAAGSATRLLLTHLGAEVDPRDALAAAARTFDGEIRLVLEGDVFTI